MGGLDKHQVTSRFFRAGLAAVFLLALAVQAGLISRQVYWISADESGRTEHAWLWATSGPQPLAVWPPLVKIVTGLALKYCSPDLFITPRAVTAFFALTALAALLALTHALFGDRRVTLATGVLAALYSHRAVLAVVPLAEMQYFTWLLWAQFFALRGLMQMRNAECGMRNDLIADCGPTGACAGWPLAASVCFLAAMMVRYEAWVFAGCYGALLVFRSIFNPQSAIRNPQSEQSQISNFKFQNPFPHSAIRNPQSPRVPWRVTLACVAILAVFPCVWMGLFAYYKGNPLGFVKETSGVYAAGFGHSLAANFKRCAFVQLIAENIRQLNILGLAGVAIWACRRGTVRMWLAIPAGAFVGMGVLGWLGKAMPAHNFWRIASIWGVMLVPFTAAACFELAAMLEQILKFQISNFKSQIQNPHSALEAETGVADEDVRGSRENPQSASRDTSSDEVADEGVRAPSINSTFRIPHSAFALALLGALAVLFALDTRAKMHRFQANPDVLAMGAALRGMVAEMPPPARQPRILIENTPDWHFLNIEVMTRSFDRFLLNSRFQRENALPPLERAELGAYLGKLKQKGIRLLVYRSAAPKERLDAASGKDQAKGMPAIKRLKGIGAWAIYELR